MRIYKYTLSITDEQTVELPLGAKILSIQTQGEMPQLWALVNDLQERKQSRRIRICGTGHQIPDSPGEYLGTFQMHDGSLVFHAFEF